LLVGLPLAAVAALIAIVLIGVQPFSPSVAVAGPSPTPTSEASLAPEPTPGPSEAPSSLPIPDALLGLDGRFTVLLLGSDYRPAHPGNRTDTIMIVSIAPNNGAVSVISIPRDTARFPMPDGSVFQNRVNALYQATVRRVGQARAGAEIRRIFGSALGLEIDAYALIGMDGLVSMVDAIGGVTVVLDKAVSDPYYWVNGHTRGVYFPAGVNHLDGPRALIFARTRKGDSDFQRVRRQQLLVLAVTDKVLGLGLAALPGLLRLGSTYVRTDLPLDRANEIFALVKSADLMGARHAVIGPTKYSVKIAGTFTYQLKLDVVRALVAKWFAPVPGPPALATPAPSETGSPAPS
jgi:LCP family protein required for cell wall assembly